MIKKKGYVVTCAKQMRDPDKHLYSIPSYACLYTQEIRTIYRKYYLPIHRTKPSFQPTLLATNLATKTNPSRVGTSISGPTVAANA